MTADRQELVPKVWLGCTLFLGASLGMLFGAVWVALFGVHAWPLAWLASFWLLITAIGVTGARNARREGEAE